jgi:hypothetical protein
MILIEYEKNKHIGDETHGYPLPDGYGFMQNFKPVIGTSFLMGKYIFHRYEFGMLKPNEFVPVAISGCRC